MSRFASLIIAILRTRFVFHCYNKTLYKEIYIVIIRIIRIKTTKAEQSKRRRREREQRRRLTWT